jgi:hypothetical protein
VFAPLLQATYTAALDHPHHRRAVRFVTLIHCDLPIDRTSSRRRLEVTPADPGAPRVFFFIFAAA